MHTDLLAVLNETLNELTEQQQECQACIERYREDVTRAEEKLQSAESERTHLEYERGQQLRKSEVLRNYISSLSQQPGALLYKVKRLHEEQNRLDQALREAESRVRAARSTLQSKKAQLAGAERRSAEIRKEWDEVSEHIGLAEQAEWRESGAQGEKKSY